MLRVVKMWRQGAKQCARYSGVVALLYACQVFLAGVAAWAAVRVLSSTLSRQPTFDRAVTGDVASLLELLRVHTWVPHVLYWLVVSSVLLYGALSLLLTGGLLGVFEEQPEGRRAVAECFGRHAVGHVWALARLQVLLLVLYVLSGILLLVGFWMLAPTQVWRESMSAWGLACRIAGAMTPAIVMALVVRTVGNFARVLLVAGEKRVRRAFLCAVKLCVTRSAPLLHSLTLAFSTVVLFTMYLLATHRFGPTESGAVLSLVVLRQCTLVARHLVSVGGLAGQHWLVADTARQSGDR